MNRIIDLTLENLNTIINNFDFFKSFLSFLKNEVNEEIIDELNTRDKIDIEINLDDLAIIYKNIDITIKSYYMLLRNQISYLTNLVNNDLKVTIFYDKELNKFIIKGVKNELKHN